MRFRSTRSRATWCAPCVLGLPLPRRLPACLAAPLQHPGNQAPAGHLLLSWPPSPCGLARARCEAMPALARLCPDAWRTCCRAVALQARTPRETHARARARKSPWPAKRRQSSKRSLGALQSLTWLDELFCCIHCHFSNTDPTPARLTPVLAPPTSTPAGRLL